MERSLARGILQEKNSGNRILKIGGLKGEDRGKKVLKTEVLKTAGSGGDFR